MTDRMQTVQGRCPACGGSSLFLGDGGHVTCSRLECPNPSAADELLHAEHGDAGAEVATWTPPPPGDRREQLPDHILALIDIPPYTSTACETAELLAAAIAAHPEHATELRQWETRQRQRCRTNNKYTGALCRHTDRGTSDA